MFNIKVPTGVHSWAKRHEGIICLIDGVMVGTVLVILLGSLLGSMGGLCTN